MADGLELGHVFALDDGREGGVGEQATLRVDREAEGQALVLPEVLEPSSPVIKRLHELVVSRCRVGPRGVFGNGPGCARDR